MKKVIKITLITVALVLAAVLLGAVGFIGWGHVYRESYVHDVPDAIERTYGDEDIKAIVASGKALYDENGKLFEIKGVNFGNLFLFEGWMTVNSLGAKYNEDGSFFKVNPEGIVEEYEEIYQEEMDAVLNERFTEEQVSALYDAYFYSYCTEQDFINIKDLGLNTIRLPMYYRNFMEGPDEALVMRDDAYEKLDYFLELAKIHGLYVILDMHGVVGGQSGYEHCGTRDMDFWTNEVYIESMAELWGNIAEHYMTERRDLASTILAYDLVNEPTYRTESGTGKLQWDVMDRLYDAIRRVDDYHVVSIEGVWYFNSLPDPSVYGWENVLYQYHFYNWSHDSLPNWLFYDFMFALRSFSDYDVPKLVGEFNFFNDKDAWLEYLDMYDRTGLGWTIWSYKIISVGWWDNSWGMAVYKMNLKNDQSTPISEYKLKLDLRTASYDEIYAEWSTQYTDDGTNGGKYKFEGFTVDTIREYFKRKGEE